MKPVTAGTASGCLVWLLVFGILSLCLCPAALVIGSFTSAVTADAVAGFLEPYLCPEDSTAQIITYETTTQDEFGNETPTTGYEMQCVDAGGTIVRPPSPDYAFYWLGLLALIGLAVSAIIGLLLAAPVGGFIARRAQRSRGAGSS